MNRSDRRAHEMCRLALDRLARDPAAVKAKALANVAVWERGRTCHPWYWERWRELLELPPDEIAAVVMADTDEGQMLRAGNPFAGLLTREERNRVHAAGRAA